MRPLKSKGTSHLASQHFLAQAAAMRDRGTSIAFGITVTKRVHQQQGQGRACRHRAHCWHQTENLHVLHILSVAVDISCQCSFGTRRKQRCHHKPRLHREHAKGRAGTGMRAEQESMRPEGELGEESTLAGRALRSWRRWWASLPLEGFRPAGASPEKAAALPAKPARAKAFVAEDMREDARES